MYSYINVLINYCCFSMTIMIPFSYSYSMPGVSDFKFSYS